MYKIAPIAFKAQPYIPCIIWVFKFLKLVQG